MDYNFIDNIAVGGLLCFTGADIAFDNGIIELISKVGVIAVLWFWLKDLKAQMKAQLTTFDKETNEIRIHYDKLIENKDKEFQDYKDRMMTLIQEKEDYVKELQNKILNHIDTNN